jgi:hypothetical protein
MRVVPYAIAGGELQTAGEDWSYVWFATGCTQASHQWRYEYAFGLGDARAVCVSCGVKARLYQGRTT